jgi:hypothetical protein
MARVASKTKVIAADKSHNANDAYIRQLEEQLAMYQAKQPKGDEEEVVISPTEYIKVMSLLPYRLNLCTKEKGQGKVFKFDKFGQVKKILYTDLLDILEVNSNFLEAGYFVILNPKVVRAHGFDELYSNVLTKDKIEQILLGTDESVALYTSASETQRKTIIDIIEQKLIENPDSLNLNFVDKISRISGINLAQKADEAREMLKPATE